MPNVDSNFEARARLGDALRRTRISRNLTLEDLAESDLGPRQWSQSHLSKVERAKEVPTGDLVHFYERITEQPPGSLTTLWEAMTGEEFIPADDARKSIPDWVMERMEMDLDLRCHPAKLIETRDLVTNRAGLEDYWTVYDPNSEAANPKDFSFGIELGGILGDKLNVEGSSLIRGQVHFGRPLDKGEWIRLKFVHTFRAEDLPPTLAFTVHSERTREAILTVRFSESTRVHVFANVFAQYAEALNAGADPILTRSLGVKEIPQSGDHSVNYRFVFPRPGMYSGLIWERPAKAAVTKKRSR